MIGSGEESDQGVANIERVATRKLPPLATSSDHTKIHDRVLGLVVER